jgi:CRP-like cAMP-binding protein
LETQNAELWFRRLKLLSSLEDDDFALLAKTTQKYRYKASDVIVKQGDAGDCMFIIVEGVVKVVLENDNGSSTVLGTLTVGEVFGEMSLLTGASRSATVSAIRPVVLYEIGKDSLGQVMKNNPAVLDGLTEILTKRQKELSAALNDMEGQDETKKNGLTLFASIKNSLMSYFLSSNKEKT